MLDRPAPVLAIVLFLAGCAPAAPPGSTTALAARLAASAPSGIVTVIQGPEITHLDASMETGSVIRTPAAQIFDTLTWRDERGAIQPFLATSWSYPNDSTLRLKIRKGVKFHDAEPLTPADVVFTYRRVIDPANNSKHLPFVKAIGDVRGVDDETVDFALNAPDATLLGRFSVIPVLPKKTYEALGPDAFDQRPVGSGPFKFREWVRGQRLVLEANPDYWRGPPKIKTLLFRSIAEDSTRVTELLTGNADIVTAVPPPLAAKVKADSESTVQQVQSLRNVHVRINTKQAPFDDPRVRQALNHAVDVKRLVASVLGGAGVPTPGGVMGPSVFGYSPGFDKGYDYDPVRARQLLAAAGIRSGFKTTLLSPQGRIQGDREVAQVIAGMLREVGIDAEVQLLDYSLIQSKFYREYNEAMSLLLDSGSNSTADADSAYGVNFVSTNRGWYWSSAELDRLIPQAGLTLDQDARLELYHRIGASIAAEAPVIFLYDQVDTYGVTKRLQGFKARADELIYLYEASVGN